MKKDNISMILEAAGKILGVLAEEIKKRKDDDNDDDE